MSLKEIRKQTHPNLSEFARVSGLTRQAIMSLESGEDCKISTLVRWAQGLDMSPGDAMAAYLVAFPHRNPSLEKL